jgi:hypothetical protein
MPAASLDQGDPKETNRYKTNGDPTAGTQNISQVLGRRSGQLYSRAAA